MKLYEYFDKFTIFGLLSFVTCVHETSGYSRLLDPLGLASKIDSAVLSKNDVRAINTHQKDEISNHVSKREVSIQNWNPNGQGFPHVFNNKAGCKRPTTAYDNWVCDPDEILTDAQRSALNTQINDALNCLKCACGNQCRNSPAPYGYYSIAFAIIANFTETGSTPAAAIEQFTNALRDEQWFSTQRCTDGVYFTLNIGDRTIWTSTGSTASQELSDSDISSIENKIVNYLRNDQWYEYLSEKIDLIADELPGQCGLTGGQIAGIVIGCILGVALITFCIVLCVGYCQQWEWVVGTCFGVCVGCMMGACQAFINALMFQCAKNLCNALGCGDCEICGGCEPLSCVDDVEGGGGGGEF